MLHSEAMKMKYLVVVLFVMLALPMFAEHAYGVTSNSGLGKCEREYKDVIGDYRKMFKKAKKARATLDAITVKLIAFATGPDVGKVPNYVTKKNNVQAKSLALNEAISELKRDVVIDCKKSPKKAGDHFLANLKLVKKALSDYRDSIQALVKEIKDAGGTI